MLDEPDRFLATGYSAGRRADRLAPQLAQETRGLRPEPTPSEGWISLPQRDAQFLCPGTLDGADSSQRESGVAASWAGRLACWLWLACLPSTALAVAALLSLPSWLSPARQELAEGTGQRRHSSFT